MMIREAQVAGSFYPQDSQRLQEDIKKMLSYEEQLKEKEENMENIIGVVVPHAGYMYSGKVAACVYAKLEFYESFIILCPNHTGYGSDIAISDANAWRLPLGEVKIDKGLTRILMQKSTLFEEDSYAHAYEHSAEVQIPFLQVRFKNFRILPISIKEQKLEVYKELGKSLASAILDYNKKTLIIASTDMTHYEPDNIAREKDNKAIEAILTLDEELLYQRVKEMKITMCGVSAVCVLLAGAKELGANYARLVSYATSAETSKDYANVVGYAGVLILKQ